MIVWPTLQTQDSDTVADGSATQRAYQDIRRMIVTGELKPGEKLKIEGLRTRLDLGASPIREALSLLTSEYLVDRIDQRGFRVAPTSRHNFLEILELRCELEELALRKSIANANDAWEESLVLNHHRLSRARQVRANDLEDRHKQFHMSLLANCGAPILWRYCSQLYDLNIRYRYLASHALDYPSRDIEEEHLRIKEYAVARKADAAVAELHAHYRRTGFYLSGLMEDEADCKQG